MFSAAAEETKEETDLGEVKEAEADQAEPGFEVANTFTCGICLEEKSRGSSTPAAEMVTTNPAEFKRYINMIQVGVPLVSAFLSKP